MRSWLRLAARYPSELSKVMQIIPRAISTHIIKKQALQQNKQRRVLLHLFNALAAR